VQVQASPDVLAPSKWRQTNRQCLQGHHSEGRVEAELSDVKWRMNGGTTSGG
jgi:hypothetical protein